MIISDTLIKYNPDNLPPYGSSMSTVNIKPTFGDYSRWSIEGNSDNNIPAFDTVMYSPKTILLLSYPNEPLPTINKNEDFNIKWNKDDNNINGVEIVINLLSSKDKKTFRYLVEDNGEFTISLKEIQAHRISLDIIRYNQKLLKIEGNYFWLCSITDATQDYYLVDN
ncbi:MAG: hypothetical protein GXO79_08920, partial [Chlorobi bacterium]|nr:hypothetical protein [Chlorobiota bacterium]